MSEVQEELYNMLVAFDEYCTSHSLRYTLLAGTLLGAARHGGFIPWDDDVDLGMPRPDYERLIANHDDFVAQTGYLLNGYMGVPLKLSPLAKIENPRIEVQPAREVKRSFLWIDISPLDAMPDNDSALEHMCARTHRYHAALNFLASTPSSGHTPLRRAIKFVCTPLRYIPALKQCFSWRLNRIAQALPWGSTHSVGSVAWGLSGPRERMDAEHFESFGRMRFVDYDLPVMGSWEQYLTQTYGPYYMQPPSSKWKITHLAGAWCVADGRPLTLIDEEAS